MGLLFNMAQHIDHDCVMRLVINQHLDEDGFLHCDDGPAVIYDDGTEEWYKHGVPHRIGGPAYISSTLKVWFNDGLIHNEDGPASEWEQEGKIIKLWNLNGIHFKDEKSWELAKKSLKSKLFRIDDDGEIKFI